MPAKRGAAVIRVGFTLIPQSSWTGGYHYLLNLLRALALHCRDEIRPVLFHGAQASATDVQPFRDIEGVDVVEVAELKSTTDSLRLAAGLALGIDPLMRRLLKRHRIDVVFENATFFGWRLETPAVAWLPDLQHRHMPHLFSRSAWLKRELGFRAQINSGRTLMLSSVDACKDCERFYPASRGRTRAVQFAIFPRPPMQPAKAEEIVKSYGITQPFIYLPNQFWVHKNHELVINALHIARQQGVRIVVAASGNPVDPRSPDHFARLQKQIATLALEKEFRLLGLVPYSHVQALMQTCTAILNPSLFEGWSTSVEEGRSMGVPLILSDLNVHHEQAGDDAVYFDRFSANSLADALIRLQPLSSAERAQKQIDAARNARQRVETFARKFVTVVERSLESSKQ